MKSCGICMITSGLEANKMHLNTPLLCLQTQITGLHIYIVLHCSVLCDVNITIWPLDRPEIAELTNIILQITQHTIDLCKPMIVRTVKLTV